MRPAVQSRLNAWPELFVKSVSGATMRCPNLRQNLEPLCPTHFLKMEPISGGSESRYACRERGCTFCWQWDTGYFLWEDEQLRLPVNARDLMKPALNRDHGYLYLESIEAGKKIWKCPVQDCPNFLVES